MSQNLTDALRLIIANTRETNPEVETDTEAVELALTCNLKDHLLVVDDQPTREAYRLLFDTSKAEIAQAMPR